jgi:hypothetical protein
MSYGDLNGGSRHWKLDGGTDAPSTAPRLAMSVRLDPDFGGCGVQERWILAAVTTGVRASLFRRSADGEDLAIEQRRLMVDSVKWAVRGYAARVRRSR